jgi:hypothetical protein
MPNDEEENDRLDIHHHIALLNLSGELYLAPIGDHPERILDLGTGTGLWAMDMGKWKDVWPSYRAFSNQTRHRRQISRCHRMSTSCDNHPQSPAHLRRTRSKESISAQRNLPCMFS